MVQTLLNLCLKTQKISLYKFVIFYFFVDFLFWLIKIFAKDKQELERVIEDLKEKLKVIVILLICSDSTLVYSNTIIIIYINKLSNWKCMIQQDKNSLESKFSRKEAENSEIQKVCFLVYYAFNLNLLSKPIQITLFKCLFLF